MGHDRSRRALRPAAAGDLPRSDAEDGLGRGGCREHRALTLDEFFTGREFSRRIFDVLSRAIADLGPSELRVTKSQVAFRRRVGFAWAWVPGKYLRGDTAPLVLTLALRRRDASPRWKEVVEPTKGRFTHHLELRGVDEIDTEVRAWLAEAWLGAG